MSAISDPISSARSTSETRWEEVVIISNDPSSLLSASGWRPSVNAYRCSDQFVIFVELAGVPADSIEVTAAPRRVMVRGRRLPPEPACRRSDLAQLLALEIDHGPFERVLELPYLVNPRGLATDYHDGLLQIRLPLAG